MVNENAIQVGSEESLKRELSFALPKAPETQVHMSLTLQKLSILLFITTLNGEQSATAPLGSFVYALPDVC
jgi:hypothetical protein